MQASPASGVVQGFLGGVDGLFPANRNEVDKELQVQELTLERISQRLDQLTPVCYAPSHEKHSWPSPAAHFVLLRSQLDVKDSHTPTMHMMGARLLPAMSGTSVHVQRGHCLLLSRSRNAQGYNGTSGMDGSTGPAGAG